MKIGCFAYFQLRYFWKVISIGRMSSIASHVLRYVEMDVHIELRGFCNNQQLLIYCIDLISWQLVNDLKWHCKGPDNGSYLLLFCRGKSLRHRPAGFNLDGYQNMWRCLVSTHIPESCTFALYITKIWNLNSSLTERMYTTLCLHLFESWVLATTSDIGIPKGCIISNHVSFKD